MTVLASTSAPGVPQERPQNIDRRSSGALKVRTRLFVPAKDTEWLVEISLVGFFVFFRFPSKLTNRITVWLVASHGCSPLLKNPNFTINATFWELLGRFRLHERPRSAPGAPPKPQDIFEESAQEPPRAPLVKIKTPFLAP